MNTHRVDVHGEMMSLMVPSEEAIHNKIMTGDQSWRTVKFGLSAAENPYSSWGISRDISRKGEVKNRWWVVVGYDGITDAVPIFTHRYLVDCFGRLVEEE